MTAMTAIRARLTVIMIARRSSRSASTPAHRPKRNGGSHCSSAAMATRNGSWVWEATSSGPAAMASPSPRLLAHDEREQPAERQAEARGGDDLDR